MAARPGFVQSRFHSHPRLSSQRQALRQSGLCLLVVSTLSTPFPTRSGLRIFKRYQSRGKPQALSNDFIGHSRPDRRPSTCPIAPGHALPARRAECLAQSNLQRMHQKNAPIRPGERCCPVTWSVAGWLASLLQPTPPSGWSRLRQATTGLPCASLFLRLFRAFE
jgi:hypothetical protein